MKSIFQLYFTLLILAFPLQTHAATEQEYLEFFNKNIELSNAYDISSVDMYSDDALIQIQETLSDGTNTTTKISGSKLKELTIKNIELTRKSGVKTQAENISISIEGNKAKVTATTYNNLNCFKSDKFYMILEKQANGDIKIRYMTS